MTKSYSELKTFPELLEGYRRFKLFCEKDKPCVFTAIRSIGDLAYSTKVVIEKCKYDDYSEEEVEEIKSILDLAGHKFGEDSDLCSMLEENLNLLELI